MKLMKKWLVLLIVVVMSVSVIALSACATTTDDEDDQEYVAETPIELDIKIYNATEVLQSDKYLPFGVTKWEASYKNSEAINVLIKSGVKFDTQFMYNFTNSVVKNINTASVGELIYSTSAFISAGEVIPKELSDKLIEKANNEESIYNLPPLLSVLTELEIVKGKKLPVTNTVLNKILALYPDNKFVAGEWEPDDNASAIVVALAPFYESNANVRALIESSLAYINTQIEGAKSSDNICSISYMLRAVLELDYYGVSHNVDEKALYDWILTKQNKDGSIGVNYYDTVQGIMALVSYQRYHNGDGGTYYRMA